MTVNFVFREMNVRRGFVYEIVLENMHMREVVARWVPRLTLFQKQEHVEYAESILDLCHRDEEKIS